MTQKQKFSISGFLSFLIVFLVQHSNETPSYLLGLGETNRLVVVVENCVIFSHKDVSQNPLWARCWNIQCHEGKQAGVSGLNDGLGSGDGIFGSSNGENNIGQVGNLGAVNGVFSHKVCGGTNGLGPTW